MMLGILLGSVLQVNKTCSYLISTGTAICGSSGLTAAMAARILTQPAKIGLTVTLYLIGSGISIATLKQVGHTPLLLGSCCGSWF